MKLILVRHGETIWNKQNRFQGKTDIPMSKIGLRQAKLLAKKLSNKRIGMIYTSKLKRAIKTAEIIKKFHKNAKIIKERNLNEVSWGLWEGLTKSEVKKKYPEMSKEREKDRFNFKVPNGESQMELKIRIKKILKKIINQTKDKNLLIVGHRNVNKIILGLLLNWNNKKMMSIDFHNASVTMLNVENNKPRMLLFNSRI